MNKLKMLFGKFVNKLFFRKIECKYCGTIFDTFIDKYLHNCYYK